MLEGANFILQKGLVKQLHLVVVDVCVVCFCCKRVEYDC